MDGLKLGVTSPVRGLGARTDIGHAEALLHDIASELLRLPVHGAARDLHLRALRLKGRLSAWTPQTPEAAVQDMIQDLTALYREAHDCRAPLHSRTGTSD